MSDSIVSLLLLMVGIVGETTVRVQKSPYSLSQALGIFRGMNHADRKSMVLAATI